MTTADMHVIGKVVVQEVVAALEAALERARAGECVAVALVEIAPSRAVAVSRVDPTGVYHLLNSGAARLAARLAAEP